MLLISIIFQIFLFKHQDLYNNNKKYNIISMFNWSIFSYTGLFFAIIYRCPQIIKIYKTKKADDLSSYSYITHNGAYISFILYLVGTRNTSEWVLCLYYILGIMQNLLIFGMKLYYTKKYPITNIII
jgi:uncharacterized protein with PQ loop repeat